MRTWSDQNTRRREVSLKLIWVSVATMAVMAYLDAQYEVASAWKFWVFQLKEISTSNTKNRLREVNFLEGQSNGQLMASGR